MSTRTSVPKEFKPHVSRKYSQNSNEPKSEIEIESDSKILVLKAKVPSNSNLVIKVEMSATKRVKQWLTFNRLWWLYDAKWQDPYVSGPVLAKYLKGEHKPIFGGIADCGDHVVVINSAEIALKADEWYYRVYFHHTGYPHGASWTKAYEVHQRDPTKIIEKAVAKALGSKLPKQPKMARLFIFKDDKLPKKIAENITDQIRPLRVVPKRLDHYTTEEVESFPKLFDYPKDYILPDVSKGKILHK